MTEVLPTVKKFICDGLLRRGDVLVISDEYREHFSYTRLVWQGPEYSAHDNNFDNILNSRGGMPDNLDIIKIERNGKAVALDMQPYRGQLHVPDWSEREPKPKRRMFFNVATWF
jgi:hypothetical protein